MNSNLHKSNFNCVFLFKHYTKTAWLIFKNFHIKISVVMVFGMSDSIRAKNGYFFKNKRDDVALYLLYESRVLVWLGLAHIQHNRMGLCFFVQFLLFYHSSLPYSICQKIMHFVNGAFIILIRGTACLIFLIDLLTWKINMGDEY